MARDFSVVPNSKPVPKNEEGAIKSPGFRVIINTFDLIRKEKVTLEFSPKGKDGKKDIELITAECVCSRDNPRIVLCNLNVSKLADGYFNIVLRADSLGEKKYSEDRIFKIDRI